jgi:SagB-type dehydrogenase family enzyme
MFTITCPSLVQLVVPENCTISFLNGVAHATLAGKMEFDFYNPDTVGFLESLVSGNLDKFIRSHDPATVGMIESSLIEQGVVHLQVFNEDGAKILKLQSQGFRSELNKTSPPAFAKIKLNELAFLRPCGEGYELRCGLNNFVIRLGSIRLLEALDASVDCGMPADLADLVRTVVWAAHMTSDAEKPGGVAYWGFEDVMFHAASRDHADYRARGATYPHKDKLPKPIYPPNIHPSVEPAPLAASNERPSLLQDAFHMRRSARGALEPLACSELMDLLSLAMDCVATAETSRMPYPAHTYPSAGGLDEINTYVMVNDLTDLPPGLFRYFNRTLVQIEISEEQRQNFNLEASGCWGKHNGTPRAVIILASKIPVLAWKYEAIAYRLALLNAGAAIQSLCLAGTSLGIGLCPLGLGDSALFSEMIGMSEWMETSIVEIAVAGKLPP